MTTSSSLNDAIIANVLVSILERLGRIEFHLSTQAKQEAPQQPTTEQAVILHRLDRLTLKRHAVLTATLGGQGYQEIAALMGCDQTTVKLHLKGSLEILQFRDRSTLLATSPDLIDFIPDSVYESRFGIGKRWWLAPKPALMAVLTATKPANNQHLAKPD